MSLCDRVRLRVWLGSRAYWALAGIAVLFAAGAALALLWWLALCAAAVFTAALAADAICGPAQRTIDVERVAPDPYALRRSATIAYRVRNRSARRVSLRIIETPTRLLRYDDEELRLTLAPWTQTLVERRVTPVERGTENVPAIYVAFANAIGLLERRRRFEQNAELRVYPDLSAVERYGALRARNRMIDAGLRRMNLRGAGTESESVREWAPGDPFRSISWKATARRGKMMVLQYEVERSQNVMIVLDTGRLMMPHVGDRRKLDYAVTAALSVARVAALANDKVGVVAFAAHIVRALAPRATGRSPVLVAQAIHDLTPRFEESDYDLAFAYVRTHVRKRSLLLLFTDMVDPVAQSSVLAHLGAAARRHVVVCAFMNDGAIERTLSTDPVREKDAFALGVALELREERRVAAARMSRLGVHVIDVPAAQLTTALIDRYLRIKQRGLL